MTRHAVLEPGRPGRILECSMCAQRNWFVEDMAAVRTYRYLSYCLWVSNWLGTRSTPRWIRIGDPSRIRPGSLPDFLAGINLFFLCFFIFPVCRFCTNKGSNILDIFASNWGCNISLMFSFVTEKKTEFGWLCFCWPQFDQIIWSFGQTKSHLRLLWFYRLCCIPQTNFSNIYFIPYSWL